MNGAFLQALSKGTIEKIVRLLRQLCVRYRLLAVFRHEAPAHVRWPCIVVDEAEGMYPVESRDRKSTRLNSSHQIISYAVFCLKKKKKRSHTIQLESHIH